MILLLLCTLLTIIVAAIVFLLPTVYDLGSYTNLYDLHTIVGKEYSSTKSTNIITNYFATPSTNFSTNATYSISPETNIITIRINNTSYTFPISASTTPQIVLPILLLSKKP